MTKSEMRDSLKENKGVAYMIISETNSEVKVDKIKDLKYFAEDELKDLRKIKKFYSTGNQAEFFIDNDKYMVEI